MRIGKKLRKEMKKITKECSRFEQEYDSEYTIRRLKWGIVPVDLRTLKKIREAVDKTNAEHVRLMRTSTKFMEALLRPDSPLCCQNHPVLQFGEYFPAFTNLHISYVPPELSFQEASEQGQGKYLVAHYDFGRLSARLILPEAAKDESGKMISVKEARDSIIVVKLGIEDGKPTMEYNLDSGGKEYLITISPHAEVYCLPFPKKSGNYAENSLGIPTISPGPEFSGAMAYLGRDDKYNMNTVLVCGKTDKKIWGVYANFTWRSHFAMLAYKLKMSA